MHSQPDPASREVSAFADTLLRKVKELVFQSFFVAQLLRSNVSAKADTSRLAGSGCECIRRNLNRAHASHFDARDFSFQRAPRQLFQRPTRVARRFAARQFQ